MTCHFLKMARFLFIHIKKECKKGDSEMNMLEEIVVVNIGLDFFREELEKQDCRVVNINWQPPQSIGDGALDFLKKLRDGDK